MKKGLNSALMSILFSILSLNVFAQANMIVDDGNIVVSNGGYLIVNGDLTNSATGNNAIANSGTIQLSGDFTNNATSGDLLSGSTGEVVLNGTTMQTIDGLKSTHFTKLKLDNSAGFTISKEAFVEGALTFVTGIVNTSAGNELSLTSTSTYSGASNSAHVKGPMKRTGQSDFVYPVGAGSRIAKLGLAGLSASNTFTVSYDDSEPVNYDQYSGANITVVSSVESWKVTPASGSPQTNMTLFYNDGIFSGVSDPSLLIGAHYNSVSSEWEEVAYISHTGNSTSGSVTFGPVTSYSSFTFGSSNNTTNPLPVEMLYFNVEALSTSIDLSWATASELKADVFEIQRSTKANDFETIGIVKAAGNSNALLTYSFNDKDVVFNQDYYYRLKQVDFDGKYEYSAIRVARLSNNTAVSINVFPNPAKDNIIVKSNIEEDVDILLFSINGKLLYNKKKIKANNVKINIAELPSGLYVLKIASQNKLYKTIQITKL